MRALVVSVVVIVAVVLHHIAAGYEILFVKINGFGLRKIRLWTRYNDIHHNTGRGYELNIV